MYNIKTLFYNNQSNNHNISPKQIVILGFLAFFIFACIENIICLSALGLYWQYYILSMALWLCLSLIFSFLFLGIYFTAKKIFPKSWLKPKKYFSNSFLILVVFLFFPHFLYTTIQILMRMPGKFYTISNLGVILVILLLFFPILYYSYNFLKAQKKAVISNSVLIIILSGLSSVFGVIILGSEFQSEQWMFAILVIILFNFIIPFLSIFVLKLSTNFNIFAKSIIASCLLISIIFSGIVVINPALRSLAFRQESSLNIDRDSIINENSPNVILITMDTTRAASMSLYGYSKLTTPNLEQFAKDAVIFNNAISSAPWTLPSHASLFTGLPSFLHSAIHGKTSDSKHIPLAEEFDTLAEILSLSGYKTGAVVANSGCLGPWYGLNQGFSYYWWGRSRKQQLLLSIILNTILNVNKDTAWNLKKICGILGSAPAKRINQLSIDWILRNDKKHLPWFLFINYMETHGTSYLPFPYSRMFTSPPMPDPSARDEKTGIPKNLDQKFISKVRGWYDNELAYLDYEIGRLLRKLKEKKIYDSTLIIVTSDHGELLGEHDEFGHEFWLYQELLHVPLIVKYPLGKKKGVIVKKYVQDIDIFAEILDQAGIILQPDIKGQTFEKVVHPIFSEVYKIPSYAEKWPLIYNQDLKTIFLRDWDSCKLIQSDRDSGNNEFYNIKIDPGEKNKLINSERIKIVKNELNNYIISLEKIRKKILEKRINQTKKLDKATIDRLRTLGYIE